MKKIVFIGGHHTPALAVLDALAKSYELSAKSFFWIGHKYSMWKDKNVSAEYQEVTGRGIPFYDLKAGKLYKTFHPLKLIRLPFGFLQAFYYLVRTRPQLIVSFGGYLAPPVVVAGWFLGIPSVTHEQSASGGWANRLVARFAKKIFVTWEESLKYFPKEKTVVTGNPLRKTIFAEISNLKSQISKSKFKTIYVTGGKQGSHVINEAVKEALPELLKKYNIIHQCGRSTVFDDHKKLKKLSPAYRQAGLKQRSKYVLKDYVTEDEIGAVFAAADIVISRAGANVVYELAALGKPAILIPIPWVSHNEQMKNAKILADVGAAIILEEKDLCAKSILLHSGILSADLEKYQQGGKRAQKLVRPAAADKIAEEIIKTISRRGG